MLKFPHEMLQGQQTEAEPHYEEQVVGWVDKGLVLLPSAFSLELQGGGGLVSLFYVLTWGRFILWSSLQWAALTPT
jgi:hypothetical protein